MDDRANDLSETTVLKDISGGGARFVTTHSVTWLWTSRTVDLQTLKNHPSPIISLSLNNRQVSCLFL